MIEPSEDGDWGGRGRKGGRRLFLPSSGIFSPDTTHVPFFRWGEVSLAVGTLGPFIPFGIYSIRLYREWWKVHLLSVWEFGDGEGYIRRFWSTEAEALKS